RGHADARRVLREYVAYGHFWPRAIEELIGDLDAVPQSAPWPEVVAGLDAVLTDRFPGDDALAEALAGLDPRERPWTMWSVENPRIARAFALEQRGPGATAPSTGASWSAAKRRNPRERGRERPAGTRPRAMTTAALLQIAEDSRWTQIADELAARDAPADVELLLEAANDPAVPMRRAAILALGRQGRREL